jgi:hypothetical protein
MLGIFLLYALRAAPLFARALRSVRPSWSLECWCWRAGWSASAMITNVQFSRTMSVALTIGGSRWMGRCTHARRAGGVPDAAHVSANDAGERTIVARRSSVASLA